MALSLLLLIVLAAADGFRISNLFQQQSNNILAVQWPPNVCRVKNWSGPGCAFDYWTIHGWWPTRSAKKKVGNFSLTEIKDLKGKMEKFWPQLNGKSNQNFWKYEWDKHGKTAGLAVHDYFEKALGYFNKVLGNCTNPERISSCLREKGEVKEYQLVKETPGGCDKGSHSGSIEHHSYIVEAWLVLPGNLT
ncbi:ribonuclease T2-like isoform X3 [Mobula birostris]|uniref:ribonuclease T2-like isoform X3 n=1 Tax=Mobula birostris TaxID=1983395 RepID=UPI003B27DD66